MSNTKFRALMGGSALVMAAGAAASASAQAVQIYGGGSSLSAPYVNAAENCYGVANVLFFKGGSPLASITGTFATECSRTL